MVETQTTYSRKLTYGFPIHSGSVGIRPVGLHSFTLKPSLPAGWDKMSLRNIRAFGKKFDLDIYRKGGKIKIDVIVDNKIVMEKFINEGKEILIDLPL
ncbi:MAG: hypothetical protein PHY75_03055 [Bacteroidales bacterium]|nr:hypothetical protein [Bacteroidales bacterium]